MKKSLRDFCEQTDNQTFRGLSSAYRNGAKCRVLEIRENPYKIRRGLRAMHDAWVQGFNAVDEEMRNGNEIYIPTDPHQVDIIDNFDCPTCLAVAGRPCRDLHKSQKMMLREQLKDVVHLGNIRRRVHKSRKHKCMQVITFYTLLVFVFLKGRG